MNFSPTRLITLGVWQMASRAWQPRRVHTFTIKRGLTLRLLMSYIQVSQEECEILRESVPYVKLCRYNPKHLYPKLNGYGDNGHRKVWASLVSTNCTPSTAQARQGDFSHAVTLTKGLYPGTSDVTRYGTIRRPAYSTSKPKESEDMNARVFVVQFNGFMSLTSYFDVNYRY